MEWLVLSKNHNINFFLIYIMEQFLQFTAPAVILLYLTVGANFISDIFGCRFQQLLTKNTFTKPVSYTH